MKKFHILFSERANKIKDCVCSAPWIIFSNKKYDKSPTVGENIVIIFAVFSLIYFT